MIVIEYLQSHNEKQGTLIFLDAMKAFENLNWSILFKVPEDIEFGKNFLYGIKSICTSQKAKIAIDGDLTKPCNIQKGNK